MDHFFWAEAFGWTPSQVRAERVGEMRRLMVVHGAAAEGREERRKREEKANARKR